MNPFVRKAELTDAEAITRLSAQLGYLSSLRTVVERLKKIDTLPMAAVLVAEMGPALVGWILVCEHISMGSEAFAEIHGLVVEEEMRQQGIGTILVQAAEIWTKDNGFNRLIVRTNVKREEASTFYAKSGFRLLKTQNIYERKL